MQFWDENSGDVRLGEAAALHAHMSRQDLLLALQKLAGDALRAGDWQKRPILAFPPFGVPGGRLACVCFLHGDRLHAAEFSVVSVGLRKRGTADQQRALLFQCVRAEDPSRDSKRGVLLRCPFGTALIATDPHSGDATLRLTYR